MTGWLEPTELRVGLGCMRLDPDDEATLTAAVDAGITIFDTARAYEGNEALLARALRDARDARIVTKGGMSRPAGTWVPDGRARAIRADCEASLSALGGLPIDLYLLHTPDPRRPWRTAVRALARLADDGLVARVGVANVNRDQLDEALELAPICAVQVALSPFDDSALRNGVFDRCAELGLTLIAHSPLGGPRRAARVQRNAEFAEIADSLGATAAEVALAWLLSLGSNIVAVPGARRPDSVRSAVRAASLQLSARDRKRIRPARPRAARTSGAEVVLVMGIPGAGKSRVAERYVARGYARLNRDERGGTLRDLASALDELLEAGSTHVVLDNTYLTRNTRSYVVEAAQRHGATVRCIWLDTPLAQAQVNLVERMLGRIGALPMPDELERLARTEPGVMPPTRQMRAVRELEPPAEDEGFAHIEHVPFERASTEGRSAVFVAAPAASSLPHDLERDAPHLVFDWRPGGTVADLKETTTELQRFVTAPVEAGVCPHPGGPPTCWCRPPLPGLVLDFARRYGVDPARSVVVGANPAHRTLANALGSRYIAV